MSFLTCSTPRNVTNEIIKGWEGNYKMEIAQLAVQGAVFCLGAFFWDHGTDCFGGSFLVILFLRQLFVVKIYFFSHFD